MPDYFDDLEGEMVCPTHRSWPQGFKGSCLFAQGITDCATSMAGLPETSRLLPTLQVPLHLPIWGSILDDVWILRTNEVDQRMEEASSWLPKVEQAWDKIGVKSHPDKKMYGGLNGEIQGARGHADSHLLGLSAAKTAALFGAGIFLLLVWRPHRKAIERAVGKVGFAHLFRPACRGSLGQIHRWIEQLRDKKLGRTAWAPLCWWELFEALLFLPLSQTELSSPWSPQVQCTDAAGSGGHGLAYAFVPKETQQRWARWCSFRGDR